MLDEAAAAAGDDDGGGHVVDDVGGADVDDDAGGDVDDGSPGTQVAVEQGEGGPWVRQSQNLWLDPTAGGNAAAAVAEGRMLPDYRC